MDMEMTKMTAKGQITLPVAIRKSLGLQPGDKVGFVREGDDIRVVNVSALPPLALGGGGRARPGDRTDNGETKTQVRSAPTDLHLRGDGGSHRDLACREQRR